MAVYTGKDKVVVSWEGLPEFQALVKELGRPFKRSEQRSAFRYALGPIRSEMRKNIPRNETGKLWFSIDIGPFAHERFFIDYAMAVGPRRKKGVYNKQGWHSHFLEGGTAMRKANKPYVAFIKKYNRFITVKGTGQMRKYRIFSRAIDAKVGEVSKRAAVKFSRIMDKIMDRHPGPIK